MTTKLTVNEQIECLKNLSQGAAAELIGITPATLRGNLRAPRNGDDSYDATKLVAWRLSSVVHPDLTDDQTESFLRCMDATFASNEIALPKAARQLSEFITQHGDGGKAMIADFVLDRLTDYAKSIAFQDSEENVRQQELYRRGQERRDKAEVELNVASVCDCGRVRNGRKWITPRVKPAFTINDVCPECATQ